MNFLLRFTAGPFCFVKLLTIGLVKLARCFTILAEMTKVHFPAHPSYFGNEFTQAEIDRGLGALKFLWQPTPVKCDLVLVTEAGKKLGVELDELDPDYLKTIAELGLDAEIEFD